MYVIYACTLHVTCCCTWLAAPFRLKGRMQSRIRCGVVVLYGNAVRRQKESGSSNSCKMWYKTSANALLKIRNAEKPCYTEI
jgi:hypothetical protein